MLNDNYTAFCVNSDLLQCWRGRQNPSSLYQGIAQESHPIILVTDTKTEVRDGMSARESRSPAGAKCRKTITATKRGQRLSAPVLTRGLNFRFNV